MAGKKPAATAGKEAKPKRIEIYGLFCPNCGELRYIGKAKDSRKRLQSHLRGSEGRHFASAKWLTSLKAAGKAPALRVLTLCEPGEWQSTERLLIAKHRAMGCDLLNVSEGGDDVQRDDRRWRFLRHLGSEIGYCRKAGRAHLAEKLEVVKAVFHASKKETQERMLEAFMRRIPGVAND